MTGLVEAICSPLICFTHKQRSPFLAVEDTLLDGRDVRFIARYFGLRLFEFDLQGAELSRAADHMDLC